MSQESNTGNSSSGKKKLILRKKGESAPTDAKKATPADVSAAEKKPMRMSLKRPSEDTPAELPPEAPLPPITPPPATTPATPPEPAHTEPERPKMRMGLKRSSTPDQTAQESAPPTPPPSQHTVAEDEAPKVRLGLKRPSDDSDASASPPSGAPKGDMDLGLGDENQSDDDDFSSHGIQQAGPMAPPPPPPPPSASMPPPLTSGTTNDAPPPPGSMPPPPPLAQSPAGNDLMGEALDKKPSHAKHIIVAIVILVALLAAIGGVGYLLMGMMGGDKEEAPIAEDTKASAKEPSSIAKIPKQSIDKAKETVAAVNAASNTDEILGGSSKPTPITAIPITTVLVEEPVVEGPSVVTYGQQDPTILKWVESLEGYQVGRGKLILNGQLYKEGAVVNPTLNVRWLKEDPRLKLLYFQDANNVTYEKEF
ncbi:hypothetical protein [Cerasicoccus arenae]|uniref:Uncharacterized protein n=1 Tax=Cerasicoccus arenae TaxID=424488 RepID=A0A8J3DGR6_9BACT|nr:hypothetical protein [Cerasicoccus arenae]MBK1859153.1 hypothetical protein [Cerasicoccus arenae]GHB98162.1 hypothetical protein GCM10007047_12700 [Cerasicoccus arenae]